MDKLWSWYNLSINPIINWKIISKNWNGQKYQKSKLTMDIIKKNPDKPWDKEISYNPNLTWEFVKQNPDEIGLKASLNSSILK